MRRVLRFIAAVAFTGAAVAPILPSSVRAGDCRQSAIAHLRAAAPDGFAVYRQMKDQDFFSHWITCDDVAQGLATAVHESVHYLTAESDAFPLVGGGSIARPHEVTRYFAPSLLAKKFKTSDFVSTYLREGRSSSSTDFLYLLDELNAYTHDLNAAIDLKTLRAANEQVDSRDGLAALMAFVALYAATAEQSQPETWSGLQTPQVAKTVSTLWTRAEGVMAQSCSIPNFGTEDRGFIRQFCQASVQASLATVIGRAPVCPTACLTPLPEAAGEPATESTTTVSVRSEPTITASVRSEPPEAQSDIRMFWSHRVKRALPQPGARVTDQAPSTHFMR